MPRTSLPEQSLFSTTLNKTLPNHNPSLLDKALTELLKPVIQEAVREAMNAHIHAELLKAEELADRLNVPVSWVYEQSRQGKIPTHRIGRYIRFDLNEVLNSQKNR